MSGETPQIFEEFCRPIVQPLVEHDTEDEMGECLESLSIWSQTTEDRVWILQSIEVRKRSVSPYIDRSISGAMSTGNSNGFIDTSFSVGDGNN